MNPIFEKEIELILMESEHELSNVTDFYFIESVTTSSTGNIFEKIIQQIKKFFIRIKNQMYQWKVNTEIKRLRKMASKEIEVDIKDDEILKVIDLLWDIQQDAVNNIMRVDSLYEQEKLSDEDAYKRIDKIMRELDKKLKGIKNGKVGNLSRSKRERMYATEVADKIAMISRRCQDVVSDSEACAIKSIKKSQNGKRGGSVKGKVGSSISKTTMLIIALMATAVTAGFRIYRIRE